MHHLLSFDGLFRLVHDGFHEIYVDRLEGRQV